MTAKSGNRETADRPFCEEQVAAGNRLFRISRLFAEPGSEPWLLPLYALFSTLEQACGRVSDESVAARKLLWWREELTDRGIGSSSHPILRSLRASGAGKRLPPASLEALVDAAMTRLDPPPPSDLDALERWCRSIGRPMVELELAAGGQDPQLAARWPGSSARSGLAQLLREGGYGWLPMDLLARHGLRRAEAAAPEAARRAAGLFREIAGAASGWPDGEGRDGAGSARHLEVVNALYGRKFKRLARQRSPDMSTELNRPRLPDLAVAWGAARRFTRP
ncbi:MAG: squalene/phytoene synthase family protein [Gammaproteobacteria bacterium]|nr:squalene/phytoene synthase family protein [Gammaproteobacteria bacterium]